MAAFGTTTLQNDNQLESDMFEILKVIAVLIVSGSLLMSQSASAQADQIKFEHSQFRHFFDPIDEKIADCDRGIGELNEGVKTALEVQTFIDLADRTMIRCWAASDAISDVKLPEMLAESLATKFLDARQKCLASVEVRIRYAESARFGYEVRSDVDNTLQRLSSRPLFHVYDTTCERAQFAIFTSIDKDWRKIRMERPTKNPSQ